MPLFDNAGDLIRINLQQFDPKVKVRVKTVAIGMLTDAQLAAIHAKQAEEDMPLIVAKILFSGWHTYKGRILKDGYSIEDVVAQIESALSCDSVVIETDYMTALENPNIREDRFGNKVKDRAILECTAKHRCPELFSVMPKGDKIKPKK